MAGFWAALARVIAKSSGGQAAPAIRRSALSQKPPGVVRRAHKVVGESHYQAALEELAGGKTAEGHMLACTADLVREPDNPHDPKAVAVFIQGRKVGYLPKGSAKRMVGDRATCAAQIVGGWRRREAGAWDEGHYGVEIDLR